MTDYANSAKKLSGIIDDALARNEAERYLDELYPKERRALRIQGFVRFLVDMAQIATPLMLLLILWRVW